MTSDLALSLKLFGPEILLALFLVVLFVVDSVSKASRRNYVPLALTLVACAFGMFITWSLSRTPATLYFGGLLANDSFSAFFRYIFFFSCGACAYLSFGSRELKPEHRMELCLLLICATFGMCLMATSTNLLMLYIGIETVSILSFVLAGFSREDLKSSEASFKYLVFGGLASGLMLYGFSLLYGYTGSLQYMEIAKAIRGLGGEAPFLLLISLALSYMGLAYKISAVPMHFWTPDVYEGAPTPVAAFFSIGPKAAGFAALLRFFLDLSTAGRVDGVWQPLASLPIMPYIAVISALTMMVGNLSAIGQTSVKRMLAYSSIAHVGYMLMALVAMDNTGLSSIFFYIIAYCAMNLGAFWGVSVVADLKGNDRLDAFRGLGWSMPVLGVTMAIFLASLVGLPVFAGFVGKFQLFYAVVKTPGYLWLALFGVLNSIVSVYYYAKILRELWLEGPEPGAHSALSLYHGVPLIGFALPTVVMGLWFTPVLRFVEKSLGTIL